MRLDLVATIVAVLAVSSLAAPARAEYPKVAEPPELEEDASGDVAVVVGIERYAFLPNVEGATQTATAWERFFTDGLGVSKVHTLLDRDATRERMLSTAKEAAEQVGDGGRLWFVFVGHGAPSEDGERGLLVGVDAQGRPKSLESRGVRAEKLLGRLESGAAERTVAIIDACFSGKAGDDEELAEGLQPVMPTGEMAPSSDEAVVITAAASDEFAGALPGEERPAFSYVLLGALRGWADADDDERVTVGEAVEFARRHLRSLDHTQTPQTSGSDGVVLTRGADASGPPLAELMRHDGRRPTSEEEGDGANDGQSEGSGAKAIWKRGSEAHEAGDFEQSARLYREACEREFGKACAALAHQYEEGEGVEASMDEAVELYSKGCKFGSADACMLLGDMYDRGRGVRRDLEQSRKLFAKACHLGAAGACAGLGWMYAQDSGGPKDLQRARTLLLKAYEASPDGTTRNRLAIVYERLNKPKAAAELFEEACETGDGEACYNYGLNLFQGKGVSEDLQRAVDYWKRACRRGYRKGCRVTETFRKTADEPIAERREALERHLRGGGAKGYLGVKVEPMTEALADSMGLPPHFSEHVVVTDVAEGSPADRAGIQRSDVILRFDAREVETSEGFAEMVREVRPGAEIDVSLQRRDQPVAATVEIGARNE